MSRNKFVLGWTTDDVAKWLINNGHEKYQDLFYRHKIDGRALLSLSEIDMKSPPLCITVLGDIKRLIIDLGQLKLDNCNVLLNRGYDPISLMKISDGKTISTPKKFVQPVWLKNFLRSFPERWQTLIIRIISASVMVSSFTAIMANGPLPIITLIFFLQFKCFQEILTIGQCVYHMHTVPYYQIFRWYFLLPVHYYLYANEIFSHLHYPSLYHSLISFGLYLAGFILFVISLTKEYYIKQFILFAWAHLAILFVVLQTYLIIHNLYQGLIWFIVPVSMVIVNDIFAYFCGFFWGRTPLIQLSPKKTWEGYLGGAVATVIYGALFSHYLCQFRYFVCPIKHSSGFLDIIDCTPSNLFVAREYNLNYGLNCKITTYPFVLHSLVLSVYSSIIGPFGGFFASGFKRAFKIKDFGDAIPGHGGILDRFDCQFLMGSFVFVYIATFIEVPVSLNEVYHQVMSMSSQNQIELLNMLSTNLEKRGLLV